MSILFVLLEIKFYQMLHVNCAQVSKLHLTQSLNVRNQHVMLDLSFQKWVNANLVQIIIFRPEIGMAVIE